MYDRRDTRKYGQGMYENALFGHTLYQVTQATKYEAQRLLMCFQVVGIVIFIISFCSIFIFLMQNLYCTPVTYASHLLDDCNPHCWIIQCQCIDKINDFKFVIQNVDALFIASLPPRPGMLGSSCVKCCVLSVSQTLPLIQHDGPMCVVV